MRRIAEFGIESHALKFWGFLKQQGIDSSLETTEGDQSGNYEIWVTEEDQVDLALKYLNEFTSDPEDSKYSSVPPKEKHPQT